MPRNALAEAVTSAPQVLDEHPEGEDASVILQDVEAVASPQGIDLPADEAEDNEDEAAEPRRITANLERQFFAAIPAGRKKIEYREATEHGHKKVEKAGKPPFRLRLINCMQKKAPELTVAVDRVLLEVGELVFEFHLGEVIDLQNWDLKRDAPKWRWRDAPTG